MPALKGIIFSLQDVLTRSGPVDQPLLNETIRLLRYLKTRGVTPVFASNHDWIATRQGVRTRIQDLLEEVIGPVPFYIAQKGTMDWKPRAGAVKGILADRGWSAREVIYVGNSDDDMRTARNGGVLFLNALWHGEANSYGFQFASPRDIARFVDCICLGLSEWFWALEQDNLRIYALAPFTTLSPKYTGAHAYSAGARATAKDGADDSGFWGRMLAARTYFSGLVDEIDYVTAYPGHKPDSKQTVIADALSILAGSLHKQYIPDLIIRHTAAQKSQTARSSGGSVGVENQLNTIHLNQFPRRGLSGPAYKTAPLNSRKTVLVVDDFCTQGNSFEAARALIRATRANVICLSWLKTINTDYRAIAGIHAVADPYSPLTVDQPIPSVSHWYSSSIVDNSATTDLAAVYARYFFWDWPT